MGSSTSHSNRPTLAIWLLLAAALTWLVSVVYTVRLNPEVAFFKAAHFAKQNYAATVASNVTKVVVAGGSGVNTSVIPTRMFELHGIRAINAGLGAGMGAEVLLAYADNYLDPGDTLIVALEPDLLIAPQTEPTALGIQFAFAINHRELALASPTLSTTEAGMALRPGGYHAMTLLGKALLRKPLYRYGVNEIHPDGWHEVAVRMPMESPVPYPKRLSPEGKALLEQLVRRCETNNVRVAYSLPFMYTAQRIIPEMRANLARFLLDVREVMPVLRDVRFGLHATPEHFTDTPFHPNQIGAELRTDRLAMQIKEWIVWTEPELRTASGL